MLNLQVLPDMGSIPYNCVSVADTGKFVAPILEVSRPIGLLSCCLQAST